jgi:hypothetical protein
MAAMVRSSAAGVIFVSMHYYPGTVVEVCRQVTGAAECLLGNVVEVNY